MWVDWLALAALPAQRDGAFLPRRPRAAARRRRSHTLPAPEDELPLLVRAGAVLPLLPAEVDTLAPYDGGAGVCGSRPGRTARAARLPARALERALRRAREAARRGGAGLWSLAIRGLARAKYTLRASLGSLRRPFRPRTVRLNGAPLPRRRLRYDSRTGVLTVAFRAGRTALLRIEALGRAGGRSCPAAARRAGASRCALAR